ncbi:fungal-specific transcription factor domain-containing protein [Sparassis latifolia]
MPADLTKPSGSTRLRRAGRKDSEEIRFESSREIELKRSRGEISCAECRRLKIRCDKTIPCQSCQRRGCATLCPNGSLATGQGTRFVLAATEHLHQRIAKMNERIRQLEDALAIAHAKYSNEPHPLLTGDKATASAEQEEDLPISQNVPTNIRDAIDAFGTLSVSDHGVSRFFGPTGGAEYLLTVDSDPACASSDADGASPESIRDSESPPALGELLRFSSAFPFTPTGNSHAVFELVESHLPPYERASQLVEMYMERAAWMFNGITREQVVGEMLPYFYRRPTADPSSTVGYSGPHALSLLFFIFAVGALVDPQQELSHAEGAHYQQLANAALCLEPVMAKPALVTIQALHLFSVYNAMADNGPGDSEASMEMSWGLFVLCAQLSHSIGLHRDSARWGLSQKVVHRRRILFWTLFTADVWQSLTTGRPPSFSRPYLDCKYPYYEKSMREDSEAVLDHASWHCLFTAECVAEVASRTLTAEGPSYDTIMELDRLVRDFPQAPGEAEMLEERESQTNDTSLPVPTSMQRFILAHSREVLLLYIHRSFFAQAIIDCPANPLRSAYASSFLTAYRSSCTIIKVIRDQFAIYPGVCARIWPIWTYAFSAAVVFGTVVVRGPRSPLASAAMVQLDLASVLFKQAANHSPRAAKAQPIIMRLSEKAHSSLSGAQNNPSTEGAYNGSLWNVNTEDFEDELEIFAGRTKLVASKRLSHSPSQHLDQLRQPFAEAPSFDQQAPPMAPSAPPASSSLQVPVAPTHSGWRLDETLSSTSFSDCRTSQGSYRPIEIDHSQPSTTYAWSQQSHSLPQQTQTHDDTEAASQYHTPQGSAEPYRDRGQMYPPEPVYAGVQQQGYLAPTELVDLGLTSRNSRLDERWTSFMHESGFLDGVNYRS